MEPLILAAFSAINGGANSAATIAIAGVILIVGLYLLFRKTEIAEVTSAGALHTQQIQSLMDQVKLLSGELSLARVQLKEIHEQNLMLMQQVRDSSKRIQELEDLLSKKKPLSDDANSVFTD